MTSTSVKGINLRFQVYLGKRTSIFGPNDVQSTEDQRIRYATIQGCLQWASLCSPSCAFVINQCARYMKNPQHRHAQLQENLLRYMILNSNTGITYHMDSAPEPLSKGYLFDDLESFADASWADQEQSNSVSTTGFFYRTRTGILMWASTKQNNVTCSTCEAEVMANRSCCLAGIWVRNLYKDIGFNFSRPTSVYQDNQSAIAVCVSDAHHRRSRHFRIACCCLMEMYQRGIFIFKWIQSEDMTADLFTKSLKKDLHLKHEKTVTNSTVSVLRD